jgi:hypothetical protein
MPDFFFYVACGAIRDRGSANESGSGTGVFTPGLFRTCEPLGPLPDLTTLTEEREAEVGVPWFPAPRHTPNAHAVSMPATSGLRNADFLPMGEQIGPNRWFRWRNLAKPCVTPASLLCIPALPTLLFLTSCEQRRHPRRRQPSCQIPGDRHHPRGRGAVRGLAAQPQRPGQSQGSQAGREAERLQASPAVSTWLTNSSSRWLKISGRSIISQWPVPVIRRTGRSGRRLWRL